jgi:hypothetical protein
MRIHVHYLPPTARKWTICSTRERIDRTGIAIARNTLLGSIHDTDPVRCQCPEDIPVHSMCNLHTADSSQGYSNGMGEEQPKQGAHLPAAPLKLLREPSTSRTRKTCGGHVELCSRYGGHGDKSSKLQTFIPVSTQGTCACSQSTSARAMVVCLGQSADVGSVPKPDTRTPLSQ